MPMSSQEMIGLFCLQNVQAKWEKLRLRLKAFKSEVLLGKLGMGIYGDFFSIYRDP